MRRRSRTNISRTSWGWARQRKTIRCAVKGCRVSNLKCRCKCGLSIQGRCRSLSLSPQISRRWRLTHGHIWNRRGRTFGPLVCTGHLTGQLFALLYDTLGQKGQLCNEMSRTQMPVQVFVPHAVVIRTFDEDCLETAINNLTCSIFPYHVIPGRHRHRVWLDVSKDQDLISRSTVPNEERTATYRLKHVVRVWAQSWRYTTRPRGHGSGRDATDVWLRRLL